MDNRFAYSNYLIRKKTFALTGKFYIYNPAGELVLFSKMKAFKLKEDIRLYSSEDMQEELLSILARNIIDFSATYDVQDPVTGEKVGALRRKGMKSMLKDEWLILDANDQEIGLIKEDSLGLALLRRFLTNLIPQKYDVTLNNVNVGTLQQNFNPFTIKFKVDFSKNTNGLLDPRLGIAAVILLCAIEGRQQ